MVRERGQVRTYGAGLLSSYGRSSRSNERSWAAGCRTDGRTDLRHPRCQPLLFCAEGFDEIEDVVGTFFADVDDEMVERLMHDASARADRAFVSWMARPARGRRTGRRRTCIAGRAADDRGEGRRNRRRRLP